MSIDLSLFGDKITEHMEAQPYTCRCQECGGNIELDIKIDDDYDMIIQVPVCECVKEETT